MVTEVLALLVQATVFKIAGSHGNHVIGGFDSHALPPSAIRFSPTQDPDMQTLISIQVGTPQQLAADPALPLASKPWSTAIYKTAVLGDVKVGAEGLHGDGQADRKHHGGADKAICVYPVQHIAYWQAELDRPDFTAGAFGENFSVAGLDESNVAIGDRWQIGSAIFEVSQPRQPCWKLARRWQAKSLTADTIHTGKTGWYMRVIQTGTVSRGDSIAVTPLNPPAHDRFSIARANRLFYQNTADAKTIQQLVAVPQLSTAWRSELQTRLGSA